MVFSLKHKKMFIQASYKGEVAKKTAALKAPLGPGFDPSIVEQLTKLELEATSFQDPGTDYCIFRGFDVMNNEIASKQIPGF